ncbi:DUF4231 domain-containing protein [Archangium gephyra]|uniref:SLATT domain-containing protein n=1 Tax=Archangium gephyra TaxID=48 RepID=UPI0035D5297C
MKPSSDNLQPTHFPSLPQPGQAVELQELYTSVVKKAQDAISWYDARKRRHKNRALFYRITAIVLAGAASIVPIVLAMVPPDQGWNPARWVPIASILAAASAGCIGIDKLVGNSASWMRYLTTMLDLEAQLEALQFAWARRALEAQTLKASNDDNLIASLNLLQEALAQANQSVKTETMEWVALFSGNLQEVEKSIVAQRAALATLPTPSYGALKLEVTNTDTLDGQQYEVQLGESKLLTHSGPTKAFTGLAIGLLAIRVTATRKKTPVSAEEVVAIRPGETTVVKLSLP